MSDNLTELALREELAALRSRLGVVEILRLDAEADEGKLRAQREELKNRLAETEREWDALQVDIRNITETYQKQENALRAAARLLKKIREWDMLDATADGPYWKREIDAWLAAHPELLKD